MDVRDLETAQHEAAHVVVGVALGLRLDRATVGRATVDREEILGAAWFHGRTSGARRREAWALMYAAGIAWDRILRHPPSGSAIDRRLLRPLVSGRHGAEVAVRAATALLAGLTREHARVTRALLEHDLTGADVAALCHGEGLER